MGDAVLVMALGMSGVLLFLLVLIGLMLALVRLCPHKVPRYPSIPGPKADADDEIVAVLQAAILVYEADKAREQATTVA